MGTDSGEDSQDGSSTPLDVMEARLSVTDPKELVSLLRGSQRYQNAFSEYYSAMGQGLHNGRETPLQLLSGDGLTDDAKVSLRRRMQDRFEESGSDIFNTAITRFAIEDIHFRYDPSMYSSEVVRTMDEYIEAVEYTLWIQTNSPDRDNILRADENRNHAHTAVMKALLNMGFTSNPKLARMIPRLVLIKQGLDSLEGAGESDFKRAQRLLGTRSR